MDTPDPDDGSGCDCRVAVESPDAGRRGPAVLVLDAADCDGEGDLVGSPACRASAVDALADRDADAVRTEAGGYERAYEGDSAALLVAAGRFVERVGYHDPSLAARARRDPLAAAREAAGRAGPVARIAAETGLAEAAGREYAAALRPFVGVTASGSRVARRPPPGAALRDCRELESGGTVRRYRGDGGEYHLTPVEMGLDPDAVATLAAARDRLAAGDVGGGERAPGRAVRREADGDDPVGTLAAVLAKHTRGHGVLADLFADGRVSEVYATAPVGATPLRVTVDGERLPTNVRLTADGAAALASRLRRTSGRAFSRASPTVDAVLDREGGRVRVAGVTAPASDGLGFAFRRHDADPWTLPALVAADSLPPGAAALLSVAVERGAAVLLAGPRGAGKTTALGALLWELPAGTRTVAVEDTPELPVDSLRARGRDVQRLRTDPGEGAAPSPAAALRTALRLGEGALVVGEVRGEEAGVLYEAMRVGAGDDAVLGTIHGSGGEAVRERVVSDLGVPESAFAATDLVVTLAADPHRVTRVEEVRDLADGTAFGALHVEEGDGLTPTGCLDRGNSRLLASLAGPGETYADLRGRLDERAERLRRLVAAGRTDPAEIDAAPEP